MTFLVMLLMPFLIQLRRKMWGPQFIMMSLDDGNVKPTELTDFQIPRFSVMMCVMNNYCSQAKLLFNCFNSLAGIINFSHNSHKLKTSGKLLINEWFQNFLCNTKTNLQNTTPGSISNLCFLFPFRLVEDTNQT